MDSMRFLTIFAVAIAGWIVIMWLTLSALDAAQHADGGHTDTPAAPAATVDAPARPTGNADSLGAGLTPYAGRHAAHLCARAGGVA